MIFNIEDYNNRCVMHCRTEEDARTFTEYLDSIGLEWCNGDSYIEILNYSSYREETCYRFNSGEYGSLGYFSGRNYEILEFSDFDWNERAEELSEEENIFLNDFLTTFKIVN